MNDMKNITAGLISAGVAVLVVVLGFTFSKPQLGASPGPDFYNHANFQEGLTDGGGVFSTTTVAATGVLTAAQMDRYKVFRFIGGVSSEAYTVTLPASTTMTSVLKNAGGYRTWVFENGSTAAATTTTIAAGTGIDLQEPDGQNVVIGVNNYAFLTCFRELSTDIVCRVDETIPAD